MTAAAMDLPQTLENRSPTYADIPSEQAANAKREEAARRAEQDTQQVREPHKKTFNPIIWLGEKALDIIGSLMDRTLPDFGNGLSKQHRHEAIGNDFFDRQALYQKQDSNVHNSDLFNQIVDKGKLPTPFQLRREALKGNLSIEELDLLRDSINPKLHQPSAVSNYLNETKSMVIANELKRSPEKHAAVMMCMMRDNPSLEAEKISNKDAVKYVYDLGMPTPDQVLEAQQLIQNRANLEQSVKETPEVPDSISNAALEKHLEQAHATTASER